MKIEDQSELLRDAESRGGFARLGAYARLSGPGWMQSALKLGASSLSSGLYLGVLTGFSLLWLQPLAMILGIIMLSAIGYVVMSTGQRPFKAINEHLSPVLGWGWAMAALMASVLWAVPQYSLAIGVVQQNLLPGVFGEGGVLSEFQGTLVVSLFLFVVCLSVAWSFGSGARGVRFFDLTLKLVVLLIVLCFVGVTIRLALSPQGFDWSALAAGFVPDFRLFSAPPPSFDPLLSAVSSEARIYWEEFLVRRQRDVIVAAAAASAGVNGTFLFAYTLVRKRWGKEFRLFSRFDLVVGMFIPFSLAVSCIVVAGAAQFHTVPQPGILEAAEAGRGAEAAAAEGVDQPSTRQVREYRHLLERRVQPTLDADADADALAAAVDGLGTAEKRLAATLVTRDAAGLAKSLEPLTGPVFAHYIFGMGVLGMCVSSIIMQMLVCGFVVCEVLDRPHQGWTFRIGSLAAAASAFVPFFWTQAFFWLAIPTSVLAAMLIPIAYTTFFLLMNRRSLLGDEMPSGKRRIAWNICLGTALLAFTISGTYMLWDRGGWWGIAAAGLFVLAVVVERGWRRRQT
ncbi:MAG: divalent metal cation transporter [Verrucomicrobiales bacterium]